MSEEEKAGQSPTVSVVALRAENYSADGANLIVSLRTKYSTAERKYAIPLECFHDLIVDLRRLSVTALTDKPNTEVEPALQLEVPAAAE